MRLVTSTNIFFERRQGPFISLKTGMEQCARAGFQYLDFGFVELSLVSDIFVQENWLKELQAYRSFAAGLGLTFVQAHGTIWDFCNPKGPADRAKLLFERSLQAAAQLEIPWVVVHPSTGIKDGGRDPKTHQKNVEFFQEYGAFAGKLGVGLAIENMWGQINGVKPYGLTAHELRQLVAEVNRDNVRICWDVEHASVEGLDHKASVQMLGKYIVATHISDELGPANIHLLPYLGKADWDAILGALAGIGYEGDLDLEIQHYLPGVPEELVPAGMRLARETGEYLVNRLKQMREQGSRHE